MTKSKKDDNDADYMTDDNSTDEESTIEKEEELEKEADANKKKSEEDEILKLQMENDLPLDVLLKDYNIDENYLKQTESMDVDNNNESSGEEEEEEEEEDGEEMSTDNGEDDEYSFPDDSEEELDDEETIEAEEKIHGSLAKYSAADELAELEADNQMPLDELLNSFKNVDQIALPETSEKTIEDKTTSSSEIAPAQDDKVLTSIAATAQSLQPTGYTLETTKVKTIIPSLLLKHTLREYQHVGLDWLVTMYENKLNGILADEMGLGKTIQTISLLAHLACEKGIWGPHLIVVPTSVMLNWELEFKKWCPGFKILTYYGNPKERKLKRQVRNYNKRIEYF